MYLSSVLMFVLAASASTIDFSCRDVKKGSEMVSSKLKELNLSWAKWNVGNSPWSVQSYITDEPQQKILYVGNWDIKYLHAYNLVEDTLRAHQNITQFLSLFGSLSCFKDKKKFYVMISSSNMLNKLFSLAPIASAKNIQSDIKDNFNYSSPIFQNFKIGSVSLETLITDERDRQSFETIMNLCMLDVIAYSIKAWITDNQRVPPAELIKFQKILKDLENYYSEVIRDGKKFVMFGEGKGNTFSTYDLLLLEKDTGRLMNEDGLLLMLQ